MNQPPCNRWVDNLVSINENLEQSRRAPQELPQRMPPRSPSLAEFAVFDDFQEQEALQAEYVEIHPNAGMKYGLGKTFLESFDDDRHAPERSVNLFFPFASKEDWQVGVWLSRSRLSMAAIDSFLSLPMVSYLVRILIFVSVNIGIQIRRLSLSFNTAAQLRGRIEKLPSGPKWNYRVLSTSTPTKKPVRLFWRDPLECLQALFNHPLFHDRMDLVPRRVYKTAEHLVRVYSEWVTGDSAWALQVRTSCIVGEYLFSR